MSSDPTSGAGSRIESPVENGLTRFLRHELSAGTLANRSAISNITLIMTYQCPASCSHCVFGSNKTRTEAMNPETARRFIAAAARQVPPPTLSFSGGEPFLRLGLMRDLACFAHKRGMISEVISSSAWCQDLNRTRMVLSDLHEHGMKTYATSVDRYHTPHVEPQQMRNAILAALDAGLHVTINTVVDPETLGQEEAYLSQTLELPGSILSRCSINRLICAPVGRARTEVHDWLYQEKDMREGCPFSTEVVTLTPQGLLYPCCGMVVGESPHQANLFIQDTLANHTVDEIDAILDALKHDLFFKLLQCLGPYNLLLEVKRRHPTLKTRERFIGSCDVCLEFTSNPAVAPKVQQLLEEYGRILSIAND